MKKYFINPEDFNDINKPKSEEELEDLEFLAELDGESDADLFTTEIVEVMDTDNNAYQFYFLEELEKDGKKYVFLQPAELIDGLSEDDVYIFTMDENGENLTLVENEELIDLLFQTFHENYKGEYKSYEDDDYLN